MILAINAPPDRETTAVNSSGVMTHLKFLEGEIGKVSVGIEQVIQRIFKAGFDESQLQKVGAQLLGADISNVVIGIDLLFQCVYHAAQDQRDEAHIFNELFSSDRRKVVIGIEIFSQGILEARVFQLRDFCRRQ